MESNHKLYEMALNLIADTFNNKNADLTLEIKKDNLAISKDYFSDEHMLFKFHGTTFGVKEKDIMPPEVKFSVDPNQYNMKLVVTKGQVNSVLFEEKVNQEKYISLKVFENNADESQE